MTSALFDRLGGTSRQRLRRARQPASVSPTLATLVDEPFSDPGWVFERKFDGERCIAFRGGDRVRLVSRNGKRLDATYPELAEAIAAQGADDFIADGEVVAFEGSLTSFARLQQRMQLTDPGDARRSGVAVYWYLFDLLHAEGHDLTGLPLRDRKRLLRAAIEFGGPLRFTPHRNRDGEGAHRRACRAGWEGVIAKDAASAYAHGRSRSWLKFKCVASQELVIGGFTEPTGSRKELGAVLVGYYHGGDLVYADKVGTGFDQRTLRRLGGRLHSLERGTSPFTRSEVGERGAHWVEPRLVAEIAFTEWTDDGRLRHPRYQGLRRDKAPAEVTREQP